jgi:hypothetical protein
MTEDRGQTTEIRDLTNKLREQKITKARKEENTKKITTKPKANEKPQNPARKNFNPSTRYYP